MVRYSTKLSKSGKFFGRRNRRARPMRYKRISGTRRVYGNGRPSDVMVYKGIGLPDQFFTKMKYTESITMTAGIGAEYQTYQFRGNSIYDPNLTGTGAQPPYFDQLCGSGTLYTQWIVTGSKIRLRLASAGDTFATGNIDACVTPSQTALASTLWTDIDDQLSSKCTKRAAVVRGAGSQVKYITNYAQTSKVMDTKDLQDQLAIYAGGGSSNPTVVWYWIIGMQGMDRTSITSVLNVLVDVTYYVKFFNLSDQDQS